MFDLVLTVLSVLLPVESGEKMGLGVTILLAQVVNLMILSGLIPTSSQNFPELGECFAKFFGHHDGDMAIFMAISCLNHSRAII